MSQVFEPEVYKTILEDMTTGVCVVDRSGSIQLWNEGAERISGYLRQEAIGRSGTGDIFEHHDEANKILSGTDNPLLGTIHDGKPRLLELFLVHRDGQSVPVRVRTVPVRNDRGAIIGAAECFDAMALMPEADVYSHRHVFRDSIDGLTGILDKKSFETRLAATLRDFHDNMVPFGVLSFSIDQLDEVRKRQGLVAAQASLRATAQTLANGIGPFDVVGRCGEDIFVIVSPCPHAYLEAVALKFQRIAGRASIPWWGGHLALTVAVGGTAGRLEDTVAELMARSQNALSMSNQGEASMTIL